MQLDLGRMRPKIPSPKESTCSLRIRDPVLISNYIDEVEWFTSPIIFKDYHLPLDKLKKEMIWFKICC